MNSRNEAAPLIDIKGVSFHYPGFKPVLNDVTFSVDPGELVTLLGPNGAGKSTLLNCIMNLLTPQAGEILVSGKPNAKMTRRHIAQTIAYVQQDVDVTFGYSVRDYVVMGRTPFLKLYAAPSRDDYSMVDSALERLGVLDLRERAFRELSGGQRQLVDVARAIVQNPLVVLFDEPTSALDYGNQVKVLKMIDELARECRFATIMTTHNPDHPILLNSSVCLLNRTGHLVKGSVKDIMHEKLLQDVYRARLIIRNVDDAGRQVCITPAFNRSSS